MGEFGDLIQHFRSSYSSGSSNHTVETTHEGQEDWWFVTVTFRVMRELFNIFFTCSLESEPGPKETHKYLCFWYRKSIQVFILEAVVRMCSNFAFVAPISMNDL